MVARAVLIDTFNQIARGDGRASVADFVKYFAKQKHTNDARWGRYFNTQQTFSQGQKFGMDFGYFLVSKGKSEDGYNGTQLRQLAVELVARAATDQGKKTGMYKTKADRIAAIKGEGITEDQFIALSERI